MSSKLNYLIWDHFPKGGGEKLTALALAEHADPDGSNCYPNVATIASMTDQSRRTVQTHLDRMLDSGWLVLVEKGGGRGKPTKYRIPIERIPRSVMNTAQKLHRLDEANPRTNGAETVQKPCRKGAIQPAGSIGTSTGTSTSTKTLPTPSAPSPEERAAAVRSDTWAAYSGAMAQQHKGTIQRHAQNNSLIVTFCKKVPAEHAPAVAAFYVLEAKSKALWVNSKHALELLVRDADAIYLEWQQKQQGLVMPTGSAPALDWWKTHDGIRRKAAELGVEVRADANAIEFKGVLARICVKLGPGSWWDERDVTLERFIRELQRQTA